jgi:hypothetical protein
MTDQSSSEPVSLELVFKIVQEQINESKQLRKEIAELHLQVTQMKEILDKVLEKDKLKRSSSSRSLDEYKNEKRFVITNDRNTRNTSYVRRRATDSKLTYKNSTS